MTSVRVPEKDSIESWIVLAASFIANVVIFGLVLCFGIYVVVLVDHFDCSRSDVAIIGSIAYGTKCLTGMVSSVCCRRFGCRAMVMVGGVVSSVGCLFSYFAQSYQHLYLTYGLINGFGLGLAYTPTLAVLPDYFDKWKYFATAFATVGSACGTFVFQPIFYRTIQTFTWRGSMLINAAISLQLVVCGSLMRGDPTKYGRHQSFSSIIETGLCVSIDGLLMLVNCMCWGAAIVTVFSLLNALVIDIGLTKQEHIFQSTVLASAVGLANVFGRVSASFIGHFGFIRRPTYYTLATFLLAIGIFCAAFSGSAWTVTLSLVVFGFGFGSMLSQFPGTLMHFFTVQKIVNAIGYAMFACGIGAIAVPPLAARIADSWSVSAAYISVSAVAFLSAIAAAIVTVKHYAKVSEPEHIPISQLQPLTKTDEET